MHIAAQITRGIALHAGTAKQLKRMPAIELVRRIKRYKDAYRTFPHMTCPFVYPVGGFGAGLAMGMSKVVEANGGLCLVDRPVDEVLVDEDGNACGVSSGGERISADCVVASPEYVPERVAKRYQVCAARAHPHRLHLDVCD